MGQEQETIVEANEETWFPQKQKMNGILLRSLMIQFITLVQKKKASNWTWVSGRRLNFPQWINNLSRSDGEVASISWKSNDECMQVKSGARDADYLYIFEFHKSNSKLQLSLKKVFKRKSIPKTLRRNKYIIMDPAGFTDIQKKKWLCAD